MRCAVCHADMDARQKLQFLLPKLLWTSFTACYRTSGPGALTAGAFVFSGVSIGEVSLKVRLKAYSKLGARAMPVLSSLYKYSGESSDLSRAQGDLNEQDGVLADRLPLLALDHVKSVNPALAGYFSEEILSTTTSAYFIGNILPESEVDYNGSQVGREFATLAPSAPA